MTKEPSFEYKSSRWTNSEEQTISKCSVYDIVHVEVLVENTMRKQNVTSLIKLGIYRDIPRRLDVRVKEESRILTLRPLSTGKILLSFIPTHEAVYYYRILIEGIEVYIQPKSSPSRLRAVKSETIIMLDAPSNNTFPGATVTFTGKLIVANSGVGVNGAKICVYSCDLGRNRIMTLGTSENDGTFCIEWNPEKTGRLYNVAKTYAKFEGDDFYKPSTSSHLSVNAAHMQQELTTNLIDATSRSDFRVLTERQPVHS